MSLSRAHALLAVADSLPDELRLWLVTGFEAWLQGQDLETALELHGEAQDMSLAERDAFLRAAIRLCPGESESAQAAYFLAVAAGDKQHVDETGREFLRMLQRNRVRIPTTIRQLKRILAGRRSDGWRESEERTFFELCPPRSKSENWAGSKHRKSRDDIF